MVDLILDYEHADGEVLLEKIRNGEECFSKDEIGIDDGLKDLIQNGSEVVASAGTASILLFGPIFWADDIERDALTYFSSFEEARKEAEWEYEVYFSQDRD